MEASISLTKEKLLASEPCITNAVAVKCRVANLNIGGQRFVFVVAELRVRPLVEIELGHLAKSSKRRTYTLKERSVIMQAADKTSASTTAKAVKRKPGFDKVRKQTIDRWNTPKVPKRMGRPTNDHFRVAVLDELIYSSVEKVNDVEKLVVQANVAYSWALIVQAAELVKKRPEFLNDPMVKKLQFTKPWVSTFRQKSGLSRRRVTNVEKNMPPVEEVRARMQY